MHYLGLALYAEGPTDYRFLAPLLLRLCEHVCIEATQIVDIGALIALNHSAEMRQAPRADRIRQAAIDAAPAWNVLFVHADADGNRVAALDERVIPGLQLVAEAALPNSEGVAVVPVRETEAWTLADGDALRSVFGTVLPDERLGLIHRNAALEGIQEPKEILENVYRAANPGRRRGRNSASALLNAIGEQVALEKLRQLPSFAQLEQDLREALRRLNVLH